MSCHLTSTFNTKLNFIVCLFFLPLAVILCNLNSYYPFYCIDPDCYNGKDKHFTQIKYIGQALYAALGTRTFLKNAAIGTPVVSGTRTAQRSIGTRTF